MANRFSKTEVRSVEDYSISIEFSSGVISSVKIMNGKKLYILPKKLYADIKHPHLGEKFIPGDFVFEVKGKKAFVRIKSGVLDRPADHVWILSLPLESVRRINRWANKVGYSESHPSTLLKFKIKRGN